MTKPQLIDLIRLLSAVETCLLMSKALMPDHIYEQIDEFMKIAKEELQK